MMTDTQQLDATFAALADPTRRAILARLSEGSATVTALAEPFDISQPAISRHLRVLEEANLVRVTIDGQRRPRQLDTTPLEEATEWINRYRETWEQNFQRLDSVLAKLQNDSDQS